MMVTLLRNFNRHKSVQITLVFDPENKHLCNGRVPVTDLTLRLGTQTDVPVCRQIKARPYAQWGNVTDFKVVIDGWDLDGNPWHPWDRDFRELRAAKQVLIDAAEAEQEMA